MTTAATICQLANGVKDCRRVDSLNMVLGLVIIGMTAGAIRFVDSNRPVNGVCVCDVTIGTSYIRVSVREER